MPQDYAQAVKWFRLAAEQGNSASQFNLGLMYDTGRGVPQDFVEALKWYRLAAEQGFTVAQTNLGVTYAEGKGVPQDYVQAHMWFNLAGAGTSDVEMRKRAVDARDALAKKMTAAQIAEAQRLARERKPE